MWIGPISTLEETYSGTLGLCNLANSIVLRIVGRGTHGVVGFGLNAEIWYVWISPWYTPIAYGNPTQCHFACRRVSSAGTTRNM